MPVSDTEEAALIIKRAPGGIEALPDADRARVAAMPDQQLDRAQEVLKGLILYQHITSAPKPQKVAVK